MTDRERAKSTDPLPPRESSIPGVPEGTNYRAILAASCPIAALEWIERDRREPDKVLLNVASARRQIADLESQWSADMSAVVRDLIRVMESAVDLMQENKVEDAIQVLLNALPNEDCRSVAK